jgi:DNA-binding transcriptional LysR family regulator
MIERHLRRVGHTPLPSLEIDSADIVMAMVAAGLGWSITTPLCVLQGRAWLGQVAALPLPGPPLSRTIHQLARRRVRGHGGHLLSGQPQGAGRRNLSRHPGAHPLAAQQHRPVLSFNHPRRQP